MDFLPSELPRDASRHFSSKLLPFIPELANDDANVPFSDLGLRGEMKEAMITCHGQLTPNFAYIPALRIKNEDEQRTRTPIKDSPENQIIQFFGENKNFIE